MNKEYLLFVPSGGLANRMRALASAYNLSQRTGVQTEVVWFCDWALNAPFNSIFEPLSEECFCVREAEKRDILTLDRPRKRNFKLPLLYQLLRFEQRIDEWQVTPLKQKAFDFETWAVGKKSYMSCYQDFGNVENALYRSLFHPVQAVLDEVERYQTSFTDHTFGLHIRRTDNRESIERSPISMFIDAVEHEIEVYEDARFFLATDDEATKDTLRSRFSDRIITPETPASRSDISGIRSGLAAMWTLAATQTIYGSAGSSFSVMAAKVGGNQLQILSK